jgi:hypothetical protein
MLTCSMPSSPWVEELGHEVIVADPNFAAMYATRSRKVKTDLRDARTLALQRRCAVRPRRPLLLSAVWIPRPSSCRNSPYWSHGGPSAATKGECEFAAVSLHNETRSGLPRERV